MHVEGDTKCMQINFGGHGIFGSEDFCPFCLPSNGQIFPSGYNSPWGSKKNRLKKFMHVERDLKCMQTNFGGHGLSGFGDIATFQIRQKFPTMKV